MRIFMGFHQLIPVFQNKAGQFISLLCLGVCLLIISIGQSQAKTANSCAKNYKNALSLAYQKYDQPLQYAVKISHSKVLSFPGKWTVAPSLKLGDRSKKMSRRARRRSKKDIRLTPQGNSHFSALSYTAQEQQILQTADSIVRWRGKDPAFNKRGRYGWLTTRIAADLRVYMRQPHHPALCTGANLMMDHLYTHSGRFRLRAALIKKLAPLAHQYAGARFRALKHISRTGRAPLFVKLGSMEKNISLNELLTKTALLMREKTLLSKMDQENLFLPTIAILKDFANLGAPQGRASKHADFRITSLPVARPEVPFSMRPTKPGQSVKTVAVYQQNSAVYGTLPSMRSSFSALKKEALRKTLAAIEAASYIDHIAQSYEALNSSMFGAISTIKKNHATHCRCSE